MSGKNKQIKPNQTMPSKTTAHSSDEPKLPFSRPDFFRDLKKAARKQDQPSQSDQEKR